MTYYFINDYIDLATQDEISIMNWRQSEEEDDGIWEEANDFGSYTQQYIGY